jgi:hypothetical protein
MFSFRRRLLCSSRVWRRRFFQRNHQSIGRPLYWLLAFNIVVSSSYDLVEGDIRSRLIRLIPPAPASSPQDAIRRLLAYRFPSKTSQREARDHWRDIVEGKSCLWKGIPTDRKETIRGISFPFIHLSLPLIWNCKAFLSTLRAKSWNVPIKTLIFATEGRCAYVAFIPPNIYATCFISALEITSWQQLKGFLGLCRLQFFSSQLSQIAKQTFFLSLWPIIQWLLRLPWFAPHFTFYIFLVLIHTP